MERRNQVAHQGDSFVIKENEITTIVLGAKNTADLWEMQVPKNVSFLPEIKIVYVIKMLMLWGAIVASSLPILDRIDWFDIFDILGCINSRM